jgi:hypothetical protein
VSRSRRSTGYGARRHGFRLQPSKGSTQKTPSKACGLQLQRMRARRKLRPRIWLRRSGRTEECLGAAEGGVCPDVDPDAESGNRVRRTGRT